MKAFYHLLVAVCLLGLGAATVSAQGFNRVNANGDYIESGDLQDDENDDAFGGGGNNSHLLLEDDGKVYPNPVTDDRFFLELPDDCNRVEYYNTLGQTLAPRTEELQNGRKIRVTTTNLNPGIYFVKIFTPRQTFIKRVIVR